MVSRSEKLGFAFGLSALIGCAKGDTGEQFVSFGNVPIDSSPMGDDAETTDTGSADDESTAGIGVTSTGDEPTPPLESSSGLPPNDDASMTSTDDGMMSASAEESGDDPPPPPPPNGTQPAMGQWAHCTDVDSSNCGADQGCLYTTTNGVVNGFCSKTPCNNANVDCAPAPAGTSVTPMCVTVGDQGGNPLNACALNCSNATCPIGMDCIDIDYGGGNVIATCI